jgi:hypothetical protein
MSSFRHVEFSGKWAVEDREQVAEAINAVEGDGPILLSPMVKLWLCYNQKVSNGEFFMASRLGYRNVLVGRSAAELAEKIRALRDGVERKPSEGA